MTNVRRRRGDSALIFLQFLASGFCGLLYQVVWTRMAFAAFGIITPVLSVVLSVFMLGLAPGYWLAGRWVVATRLPAIVFYAMAELGIGVGAFAVRALFGLGERVLLGTGEAGSGSYLLLSAIVLACSIFPWCVFTKFMVHLPLAFQAGPPKSALIICFGMGTTFRSALSWGIEVTSIELVPSVRDAFSVDQKMLLKYPADKAQTGFLCKLLSIKGCSMKSTKNAVF